MKLAARTRLWLGLATLVAFGPNAGRAQAPTPAASALVPTIIILDASGSMRSRIKGGSKTEIARRVVRELVERLPDDTRLGLVAYGHRRNDCDDIELLIPPGKLDRAAFVKAVKALRPQGRTPIAAALRFSADAMGYRENHANIVLVSDGEETCEKDPCDTARTLAHDGAGLTIHTVGFGLTAREAESIECIALATGGRFFPANDATSLRDALELAIGEIGIVQTSQETLSLATLKAPAAVTTGAALLAEWSGPGQDGDYLTLVPRGTPDGVYRDVAYTRRGNPVEVRAPAEVGDAELRYISARSHTVLARLAIEIVPAKAKLSAPNDAHIGSTVVIDWTGPAQPGDYLTIVPKDAPDGHHDSQVSTARGSPVTLAAPSTPGDHEVRYMSGRGNQTLARRPLQINAASIALEPPGKIRPGSVVPITWSGPNRPGDYLTIVPAAAPDGRYLAYVHAIKGSPAMLAVPLTTEPCEVRYMSGQGNQVLSRHTLEFSDTTARE